MRLRTLLALAVAAPLGGAVVVLPALAASSEAKIEVNENCNYPNWPCWTSSPGPNPPPANVTTIAAGGVVTLVDKTNVAASLAWTGAAPTCSPTVPVSPAPASTGWEGTCKFEQSGRYTFESATMYPSYRSYEVVVAREHDRYHPDWHHHRRRLDALRLGQRVHRLGFPTARWRSGRYQHTRRLPTRWQRILGGEARAGPRRSLGARLGRGLACGRGRAAGSATAGRAGVASEHRTRLARAGRTRGARAAGVGHGRLHGRSRRARHASAAHARASGVERERPADPRARLGCDDRPKHRCPALSACATVPSAGSLAAIATRA